MQGFTRSSLQLLIGVIIGWMWSYATLGPYKVMYIYYGVGNVVGGSDGIRNAQWLQFSEMQAVC